jgi:hypothetical protein
VTMERDGVVIRRVLPQVPSNPTVDGLFFGIWFGIETSDNLNLIQPVMPWLGDSSSGWNIYNEVCIWRVLTRTPHLSVACAKYESRPRACCRVKIGSLVCGRVFVCSPCSTSNGTPRTTSTRARARWRPARRFAAR